jgi:hypothetical protein
MSTTSSSAARARSSSAGSRPSPCCAARCPRCAGSRSWRAPAAPPEIEDHEWAALARDPAQRGTLAAGWILAVLGLCGLAGFGLYALGASAAPLVVKLFLGAFLLGGTALFLAVLRARLRILPHDPYRDVQR